MILQWRCLLIGVAIYAMLAALFNLGILPFLEKYPPLIVLITTATDLIINILVSAAIADLLFRRWKKSTALYQSGIIWVQPPMCHSLNVGTSWEQPNTLSPHWPWN